MNNLGKGIGTLGIGLALAAIGWNEPVAGAFAMFPAILIILFIWSS